MALSNLHSLFRLQQDARAFIHGSYGELHPPAPRPAWCSSVHQQELGHGNRCHNLPTRNNTDSGHTPSSTQALRLDHCVNFNKNAAQLIREPFVSETHPTYRKEPGNSTSQVQMQTGHSGVPNLTHILTSSKYSISLGFKIFSSICYIERKNCKKCNECL